MEQSLSISKHGGPDTLNIPVTDETTKALADDGIESISSLSEGQQKMLNLFGNKWAESKGPRKAYTMESDIQGGILDWKQQSHIRTVREENMELYTHTERASKTHDNFIRQVRQTGVTLITNQARTYGFGKPEEEELWANFGQGAPECGPIPGGPERSMSLELDEITLEYGPVAGIKELREKVADYYNEMYRKNKDSKYTYENVMICPGGRGAVSRALAAMREGQVGYFLPDYTAYQEALSIFAPIQPVVMFQKYFERPLMSSEDFENQVSFMGLSAVLLSNPVNPTGQVLEGEELKKYVNTARKHSTCVIFDEFYSHYYFDHSKKSGDVGMGLGDDPHNNPEPFPSVSCARYVEDVNEDPIIIVNGLTKSWRCPGLRICWCVAPKDIVTTMTACGSFLEGGANHPFQKFSLPLMDMDFIKQDALALQAHFLKKRDYMIKALSNIGIFEFWKPETTFYIFAYIGELPHPINDCECFVQECLKEKVILVPGNSFDIDPKARRNLEVQPYSKFVRISYGPPMEQLQRGIAGITRVVEKFGGKIKTTL